MYDIDVDGVAVTACMCGRENITKGSLLFPLRDICACLQHHYAALHTACSMLVELPWNEGSKSYCPLCRASLHDPVLMQPSDYRSDSRKCGIEVSSKGWHRMINVLLSHTSKGRVGAMHNNTGMVRKEITLSLKPCVNWEGIGNGTLHGLWQNPLVHARSEGMCSNKTKINL